MIVLVVLGAIVVLALLFALFEYNGLVRKRNAVDNSWAQIEAALQRRHDLIPNLVEAVKGYAKHEQKTFEDVTKARGAAQSASAPETAAAAEGFLGAAIGRLMVVAEPYPNLRATENFQQLQARRCSTSPSAATTRPRPRPPRRRSLTCRSGRPRSGRAPRGSPTTRRRSSASSTSCSVRTRS